MKDLVALALALGLSLGLLACGSQSETPSSDTNAQVQAALSLTASHYLALDPGQSDSLSGVQVTGQCSGGSPVTLAAGNFRQTSSPPITATSIFQIGSITKSFTSVVMLQLAAEKNFSIDAPLSHVAPLTAAQYPQWANITIRQLLNMTSGIPDYETQAFEGDVFANPTEFMPISQVLSYIASSPLLFPPGTGWSYSNSNYSLLADVIVELTGTSPQAEIESRIISKLQLQNTYYPEDQPAQIAPPAQLVYGYIGSEPDHVGTEILPHYTISYANTGGAIISTSDDINLYIHALFTPNQLLSNSQLDALFSLVSRTTGQPLDYPLAPGQDGFGLGVLAYNASNSFPNLSLVYTYTGQTFGFTAFYAYDAATGTAITMMMNSTDPKDTTGYLFTVLNQLVPICKQ